MLHFVLAVTSTTYFGTLIGAGLVLLGGMIHLVYSLGQARKELQSLSRQMEQHLRDHAMNDWIGRYIRP